jgi:iron complex outermembrane receptor protein
MRLLNRYSLCPFFCLPLMGVLVFISPIFAQDQAPTSRPSSATSQPASRPASVEGEELLQFSDIPVVISAARSLQKVNWLSVPVSVVTAEDIHYSGVTSVPEILQFVPGMDVLKVNRWRYAVGVRGMHEVFADRTLTLLDGRSTDSPFFGGSEYYRLPLFMEDIHRIEIVRGPGSAAWGANAYTGLINIITKDPKDCPGTFVSTQATGFGDSYTQVRSAETVGNWAWRMSGGYEDQKSSNQALDPARFTSLGNPAVNSLIGFDDYKARDYNRKWMFDGKGYYQSSPESKTTFGAGYSEQTVGDFEFFGLFPPTNGHLQTFRPFTRVDLTPDDDSTGYLQWYGDFERTNMPSITTHQTRQNDLEAQYSFHPTSAHKVTAG